MKNIYLSFAAKFFNNLHFFSPVMLLYFSNVVGLSASEFFYLQGLFSLFIFVLEVPTGVIADKFSRKLSVLLGSLAAVVGSYLMFIANSFMDAVFAEFFMALGFALTSGAFGSLFYDSHVKADLLKNYKRNLGFLGNLSLIGIFVSAISGAFLADFFGLEYIYLITGFACLLGFVAVCFMQDIYKRKVSEVARNRGVMVAALELLKVNHNLKMLAFDLALIPAISFMGIWLYQPFLQSYSASVYAFGFLHAAMVLMQVLINFAAPFLKNSLSFYIRYSQLAIALLFLLLTLINNVWLGSLCLVLIVGIGMTRNTFLNLAINSHIRDDFRATFFSGVSMVNQLLRMLLTFGVGFLIDYSFHLITLILSLVLLLTYMFFQKHEKVL